VPTERCVPCAVDLAHTSTADELLDPILSERCARFESHRSRKDRRIAEGARQVMTGEQDVDFLPQRGIGTTRFNEERLALLAGSQSRGVEDFGNSAPALRRHR